MTVGRDVHSLRASVISVLGHFGPHKIWYIVKFRHLSPAFIFIVTSRWLEHIDPHFQPEKILTMLGWSGWSVISEPKKGKEYFCGLRKIDNRYFAENCLPNVPQNQGRIKTLGAPCQSVMGAFPFPPLPFPLRPFPPLSPLSPSPPSRPLFCYISPFLLPFLL